MRFNQSLDSSILDLEALQVLGESHLESQDFQHQVCLLQQLLTLLGIFRLDQGFQKIVKVALSTKRWLRGNLPV